MIGPSPPRLIIPSASGSAPGQSPNGQTGRPTMWTPSALRKMARLYLYTDLTLPQIVKIVHHCQSSGQIPGKDSANKKLNAMFDQQPRWLRPSSSNMADRLEALSNSPTRTTLSPNTFPARPHSASDPSPYAGPFDLFSEPGTTPSPFGLSPASALTPDLSGQEFPYGGFSYSPAGSSSYGEPAPSEDFRAELDRRRGSDEAFVEFVRKTTFMSSSTDHTTGSFQELLSDRSVPYVQAVRRLVKRFTLPINGLNASRAGGVPSSWATEADCPTNFQSRPSPLPGDFISMSLFNDMQGCDHSSEFHSRLSCLCAARASLPPSPWIADGGITLRGQQIYLRRPQPEDITMVDSCGNTMLHYVACNDGSSLLLDLIASGTVDRILKNKNSAGQTFLHVINVSLLANIERDSLFRILLLKLFDLSVKDHYGRTIFHMLLANGVPQEIVYDLWAKYGTPQCNTRDAFGVIPVPNSAVGRQVFHVQPQQMDLDDVFAIPTNSDSRATMAPNHSRLPETHIIEDIRQAQESPAREDENGSNGLQSLARATLSLRSIVDRNVLFRSSPERSRRVNQSPDQDMDSSSRKMQLRLELAESLLLTGVDPNHYDKQGNTPLMAFAAELPEDDDYKVGPEILNLLLDKGADIHARNRAGETALHVAVRCGRKLAVRTLFNRGANIHVRDADGRSLLEVADVKIRSTHSADPKSYAHFEACRAWLSGQGAVQEPTVLQEWGVGQSDKRP